MLLYGHVFSVDWVVAIPNRLHFDSCSESLKLNRGCILVRNVSQPTATIQQTPPASISNSNLTTVNTFIWHLKLMHSMETAYVPSANRLILHPLLLAPRQTRCLAWQRWLQQQLPLLEGKLINTWKLNSTTRLAGMKIGIISLKVTKMYKKNNCARSTSNTRTH